MTSRQMRYALKKNRRRKKDSRAARRLRRQKRREKQSHRHFAEQVVDRMKSRTEEAVFGDSGLVGGLGRGGESLVTSKSMPSLAAPNPGTQTKNKTTKRRNKRSKVMASTNARNSRSNEKRSIYTRATLSLSNEAALRSQALDMAMLENVDAISLTKRRLQGAITQSRIILLGSLDSFFRRAIVRFRHAALAGAIEVWRLYAARVGFTERKDTPNDVRD